MQDLIAEIRRKVAEYDRVDLRKEQKKKDRRYREAKRRRERPEPRVDPWRCPLCGHLIQVAVCLECQNEAKRLNGRRI